MTSRYVHFKSKIGSKSSVSLNADVAFLYSDPFQMKNLLAGGDEPAEELSIADRPQEFIVNRLDTLIMVLKSCKGDVCRDLWGYLHPDGSVRNLQDALTADLDGFYAEQPKVDFLRCELGYLLDAEGPQDAIVYGGASGERRGEMYYGDEFRMWT
jgi:N-acetylglucosamine-6-sulfatase